METFGIEMYLSVHHPDPKSTDGEGMLNLFNVFGRDNKFEYQRPKSIALIHNLIDAYVDSHGGDSKSNIWHVDNWTQGVKEFVSYLKSSPYIINVEVEHLPSKGGVNAEFNETFKITLDTYPNTLPKDLE
jgi:hypothetical protein